MLKRTKIEWTDGTWNVWSGCREVSLGCDYCYAKTLAERFGAPAYPNGFKLTWRWHKLDEPLGLKENSRVFVNSMTDFFLSDQEFNQRIGTMDAARDRLLDVMRRSPQVQFQILTKRPAVAAAYCASRTLPRNVWLGVSLDTAKTSEYRLRLLRDIDVATRFVSAEPLLSALPSLNLAGIHWLIAGGESGGHLRQCPERALVIRDEVSKSWVPRPDRIDWVRSLRDQCADAGVPFFFKQWGGPRPKDGGNVLDGKQWLEYPETPVSEGQLSLL